MADPTLTRRELILGARDATTGWCAKTYATSTVTGAIFHQGETLPSILSQHGLITRYPHTGFIPDVIHEDDELINANGDYFLVQSAKERWWLDQFDGYECNCQKIKQEIHADRPATSGVWHKDGDNLVTDIRYRTKSWLSYYLAVIPLYKDNGSTAALNVVMFAKPDYHLWREFVTNSKDVIAWVDHAECKPRYLWNHYPYAYDETATIKIGAINKSGITGTRLVDSFFKDIEKIATDHPIGSLRGIESTQTTDEDLGGFTLYSRTITLKYSRWNSDYMLTYPTITWGPSAVPTGTFTFPNVTRISGPFKSDDAWLKPPGFSGILNQALGSGPIEIELTCDLDMEPSVTSGKPTWRRPQTTQPKTDGSNYDIFLDLIHNEGISQAYHTLTLQTNEASASTMAFKVRLVSVTPDLMGEGNKVTLLFREYMTTSASTQTIAQRFGITA